MEKYAHKSKLFVQLSRNSFVDPSFGNAFVIMNIFEAISISSLKAFGNVEYTTLSDENRSFKFVPFCYFFLL